VRQLMKSQEVWKATTWKRKDNENPDTDLVNTVTRHIKNETIPRFIPPSDRVVVIPVAINNRIMNGLIDTGSTLSIMTTGMAELLDLKVYETDRAMTSATGHYEDLYGQATVNLEIGHQKRIVNFQLSDNPFTGVQTYYDVVIGGDSMRKFPAYKVDMIARTFTMLQDEISMKSRREQEYGERELRTIEPVDIPPGEEREVACAMETLEDETGEHGYYLDSGYCDEIVITIQDGYSEGPKGDYTVTGNGYYSDVAKLTNGQAKVTIFNPQDTPLKFDIDETVAQVLKNKRNKRKKYREVPIITLEKMEELELKFLTREVKKMRKRMEDRKR